MTATQVLERRIVQQLLQGPMDAGSGSDSRVWADRLIRGLAAGAALGVVMSWVPGLALLAVGAATVWALGMR